MFGVVTYVTYVTYVSPRLGCICIASPFVPNRAFLDDVGDVGDGVVIKITETREHCRIFFEFCHSHTVTNVSNIIYKVDLEIH